MEEKYGVKGNFYDKIFFTESNIPGHNVIQHIHVEISRQNSDLTEVKKALVKKAIPLGANVIMNFRYGQKQHTWWEQMLTFKWDTESWHGDGDALIL